jgi:hypothetical protein
MKCLREAYKRDVKVHGFALTNSQITTEYPFYSVDSTTWINTSAFGTVLCLDDFANMRQKPANSKKALLKNNIPVDMASIHRKVGDRVKKLNYAAERFREYEQRLTSLWEARGVHWKD